MIPKNSYAERKVGCPKVRLYGGNTNAYRHRHCIIACRHWFERGAFPTSENLSFSTGGSVMRLKEH